jgi:ABC-type multidrug transport system permease subunit
MISLIQIVKKNLKVLLRSKSSALIVIFGPLLLIFILGIAFDNSNTYALNLGVYSTDYNDLTLSFIEKLREKEFNVQKVDNEQTCVHMIKEGRLHACIVFPKDLTIDKKDLSNEIQFYVDYSRINMIYIIIETLTSKLSLQSKELSLNLTNVLLEKLEATRVEVFNGRPLLSKILDDTQSSKSSLVKVKTDLANVDLSLQGTELTEFETTVEDILEFREIEKNIRDKIRIAKANIDIARSQYASGGGGDATADRKLKEAKEELDSVTQNLTGGLSGYSDNLGSLETEFSTVKSKIDEAKKKLDGMIEVREINAKDLDEVTSLLTSSEENLNKVLSSFDKIDEYIGSIQVKNADDIVSPIRTAIKAVTSETTHLNYIFPSLIVLVVMFVSIILGSTLVMMERHSPAYFRNFITPVNDWLFVFATFVTTHIIVFIQVAVIIGISAIFFQSQILPSLAWTLAALILITSVFALIGMTIGYVFNSEETAMLATIILGSIFLFFSNLIIPIESIPGKLAAVAKINPFVLSESLLKKIIIFQPGINSMIFEIGILVAFGVVFTFLLLVVEKYRLYDSFLKRKKKRRQTTQSAPKETKVESKFKEKKLIKSKSVFRYLKK